MAENAFNKKQELLRFEKMIIKVCVWSTIYLFVCMFDRRRHKKIWDYEDMDMEENGKK